MRKTVKDIDDDWWEIKADKYSNGVDVKLSVGSKPQVTLHSDIFFIKSLKENSLS